MKQLKLIPLVVMLNSLFVANTYAADASPQDNISEAKELQTVSVRARRAARLMATEVITREKLSTEMVRDNRDLVRYSPDVGLADSGRHQKGFAIRGVENNRVGISIDGVNLPDSEENSLYARYGNFNSSRLAIDPELVRNIEIVKGADSFNTGSGALGGGVNYRTLEARDILLPERQVGLYLKSGYGSRNREWTNTVGVGIDTGKFDATLLYSHRRGHETESQGNRGYTVVGEGSGTNIRGSARGIPDPAKHLYDSYLLKLGYQINESHRIGFAYNGQNGTNKTIEESYNLTSFSWREANDRDKRDNFNLNYEYTPESNWLSRLKVDADYQKTEVGAINYKGNYPTDYSQPYPWPRLWNQKDLDEIYNRNMQTEFKRITLRMDSQPLKWGGVHQLSLRLFAGEREFENINRDDIYWRGAVYRSTSSIQHPVKTTNFGVSLQDNIRWNDRFSSRIGIRYDYTKMAAQDLNAACNQCSAKPAPNSFSGWSGFAGVDMKINPAWQVGYNFSTGFRVPTASEMYFTFNNGAATWVANPNLKAERSMTHNLSLHGQGAAGTLDLNLYQTNYRHFLSEEQYVETVTDPSCPPYYAAWGYCTPTRDQLYWHMDNIDKARIRGIEFTGRLNLDKVLPFMPDGWKLMGSLGYAKSKLSGDNSLLSTQPLKAIIGLDYESPSEKWGIFSRLTYLGAKKPKDAQYTEYESQGSNFVKQVKTYPWLNKSAYVVDVFGFYRPSKNFTIRAGVYNLFNRKYQTWDSLRGIYSYSTTNAVDRNNKGLERFYAPGRNYAVSLEMKF